jgi:hypothetical protein
VYFNYEIDTDDFIREKKIWQNHLNLGLFREVMFGYYLKKHKGIISDIIHSPNGEKYWKKILKQSIDRGFKVYVLKKDKEKTPINDINDIDKYFTSVDFKFVIENG